MDNSPHELRQIRKLIGGAYLNYIMEAWYEHCGKNIA